MHKSDPLKGSIFTAGRLVYMGQLVKEVEVFIQAGQERPDPSPIRNTHQARGLAVNQIRCACFLLA
jgi:hypothetical protein